MIRAAVVGIGHWGRTLVNAVQGSSDKIRFTAGHTRTPARAEAFCAEKGIALYDSLDAILADPAAPGRSVALHATDEVATESVAVSAESSVST